MVKADLPPSVSATLRPRRTPQVPWQEHASVRIPGPRRWTTSGASTRAGRTGSSGSARACSRRGRTGSAPSSARSSASRSRRRPPPRSTGGSARSRESRTPPAALLELGEPGLRGVGLSGVKARYVLNLSQAVHDGTVPLDEMDTWDDDAIVARLTSVKGVGVWTAEMFLIFALNRPDVLPVGDLGVRVALRNQYGLADLPKPHECRALAEPWRPYRSVAIWYLWREFDTPVRQAPRPPDDCRQRRASERGFRPDREGRLGDRRLGRPPLPGGRRPARHDDRRRGDARGRRGGGGRRRHGPLRRPGLHRRARPRRRHAPGRPDPPPRAPAGGDHLHHRPGRQLVRPRLARHARLHEAVHRRLQRQSVGGRLRLAARSASTSPASTAGRR